MIVTITCNPAIDKTIYDDNHIFINIGGKGINVSKVLNNMGCKSVITGFVGKDNKDIVLNDLKEYDTRFIEVDGLVRTNTKLIINNQLIEKNESGPFINENNLNKLYEYISTLYGCIIVISGSISQNVDNNYYAKLIKLLKKNDNYVIVDADNELLKNAIQACPNIIKPNKDEICRLFGIEYNETLIIDKCRELIEKGIEKVVVSLGEDGAIFIDKDSIYKCEGMHVDYKSSLGAGDAMVAGLAYGIEKQMEYEEIIKLCMAASAASVSEEGSNPPSFSSIKKLINGVIIKRY